MIRWIGAIFLGLTACTTPDLASFRDPNALLSATTRFVPDRFAGEWTIVASFARDGTTAPKGVLRFAFDPVSGRMMQGEKSYTIPRPGVLETAGNQAETLVVMWVDTGFRTAVIGTKDGRSGAILNRGASISKDRFIAAKDILEFYGWDISQLVEVST